MASARPVRDSDTALWLHNKLGSSEELWVSSSIGGIIKTDTIDNIYRCFPVLTTTVKMKLLLGILHLPRRSLEEMKHTIDGLVELAMDDVDQWVKLIANIVKTYPMMCKLSLDLSSNDIAANVITHLEEKVRESDIFATLPLECQYVNKNALQNLVGNQQPARRHFALKRKPKSAALRVDLMQKSTDASSQAKRGGASGFFGNKIVPVKHRDMTRKLSDASPMRGIPKTPGGSHRPDVFRSPSLPGTHASGPTLPRSTSRFPARSERGTKLLDISEQPVAVRESKRRKKQQQEEESTQQPVGVEDKDETPEYAQGLVPAAMAPEPPVIASNPVESADAGGVKESEEHPMDVEEESAGSSYSPPPESTNMTTKLPEPAHVDDFPSYAMPATPSPYFKPATAPPVSATIGSNKYIQQTNTSAPEPFKSPPAPQQASPVHVPLTHPTTETSPSSYIVQESKNQTKLRPETTLANPGEKQTVLPQMPHFYAPPPQTQQSAVNSQQQKNRLQPAGGILPTYASTVYHQQVGTGLPHGTSYVVAPGIPQRQVAGIQLPPGTRQVIQVQGLAGQNPTTAVAGSSMLHYQPQQQAPAPQPTAKKDFTLTRQQMAQAQEIFGSANRLSRQDKAIILGFIAGSRNNPSPERGDILQITLSEHEQTVQVGPAGIMPVIVETFFEMNYRTGETSKKRRIKPISGNIQAFGV